MCTNTGNPALFFHPTEELLRRAGFLQSSGFKKVVVTGGEATIHPGFWTIVEWLAAHAMIWDINTHGGSFSKATFARRAVELGLHRAIVSLHAFEARTSAAIFGVDEQAHHATIAGIDRLLGAGVDVMLNCVVCRQNLNQLEDYLWSGHQRFEGRVAFKFVFPSTGGKGGAWPGIALRYADVFESLQRLRALAKRMDVRMVFESFPSCVLQDSGALNYGRSAFGETHYLDDARGDRVYSMRSMEVQESRFGEVCRHCVAIQGCSGVSRDYARQHGVDELTPFLPQHAARIFPLRLA
jgi:MoaA/NifB/PqqE/SkfB family radical SAM enzyme